MYTYSRSLPFVVNFSLFFLLLKWVAGESRLPRNTPPIASHIITNLQVALCFSVNRFPATSFRQPFVTCEHCSTASKRRVVRSVLAKCLLSPQYF